MTFAASVLIWTAVAGSPAPGAPAVNPPEDATAVRVIVCGDGEEKLRGTASEWLTSVEKAGVKVAVAAGPANCATPEPSPPSVAAADVSLQAWLMEGQKGRVMRTRVSFATTDKLTVTVSGRTFSAAIASRSLDFPARPFGAATNDAPPESAFVAGIVALTAYRQRGPRAKAPGEVAALARLGEWAQAKLQDADSREVEIHDPETSAVIKQLRAILILEGACSADTAAGLLRAAARLIPHDSEARAAAAIGRLLESNAPAACPHATENELLQSLALDRWSPSRVDDLGRFYELSLNATSDHADDPNAVPSVVAAQRLEQVWEAQRPTPPRMLELAVSAGIAKSAGTGDDLLSTLAPAARFEATLGRDSPGFGLRLAGTLPWTREQPLGSGTVSWTRLVVSVGGRYRNRVRRFYWEGEAGILLAPALASGHGFDVNMVSVGFDAGAALGARLGLRLGRYSLWMGLGGSYFGASQIPGWPDLTIRATGVAETSVLPAVDVTLLVGVSQLFWR